eukprot:gene8679-1071_t
MTDLNKGEVHDDTQCEKTVQKQQHESEDASGSHDQALGSNVLSVVRALILEKAPNGLLDPTVQLEAEHALSKIGLASSNFVGSMSGLLTCENWLKQYLSSENLADIYFSSHNESLDCNAWKAVLLLLFALSLWKAETSTSSKSFNHAFNKTNESKQHSQQPRIYIVDEQILDAMLRYIGILGISPHLPASVLPPLSTRIPTGASDSFRKAAKGYEGGYCQLVIVSHIVGSCITNVSLSTMNAFLPTWIVALGFLAFMPPAEYRNLQQKCRTPIVKICVSSSPANAVDVIIGLTNTTESVKDEMMQWRQQAWAQRMLQEILLSFLPQDMTFDILFRVTASASQPVGWLRALCATFTGGNLMRTNGVAVFLRTLLSDAADDSLQSHIRTVMTKRAQYAALMIGMPLKQPFFSERCYGLAVLPQCMYKYLSS